MGNPYYIPKEPSMITKALPFVNTALRFQNLKQSGELSRKEIESRERISSEKLGQEGAMFTRKYGTGVGGEPLGIETERTDLLRRGTEMKEREAKVKWESEMSGAPKPVRLKLLADKIKAFEAPVNRIMEGINSGEIKSRWDVYNHLKSQQAIFTQETSEKLLSEIKTLTKNGKNTEAQQLGELYNVMQKPTFLEEFFGFPKDMMPDKGELSFPTTGDKAMKSWVLPDGSVQNLPNNQTPPQGAIPYSAGMDIDVGPDGAVSVRTGVGRQGGMERKTKTDIEGKLFNAKEGIARLNEISASYSPEFLQFETKFNSLKSSLKEKFKGTNIPFTSIKIDDLVNMDVSDKDRQQLESFSLFKRDALNNINLYIKEITGAQMSEKEADRIRKAMPDPGEGLFDGDSPTAFESKWRSTMHSMKMAQARYVKYLKMGIDEGQAKNLISGNAGMSLGDIEKEINRRGDELKRQGMDNNAIFSTINQEFFNI